MQAVISLTSVLAMTFVFDFKSKAILNRTIQTKKLPHTKRNHQQNEKATDCQEIFVSHLSDKAIFKLCKEFIKLQPKKKIQFKNDRNTHFSKEDKTDGQQVHEKVSTPLIIREMQIKTTVRYSLTPVRITFIKEIRNNSFENHVEKRESLRTVGGEEILTVTVERKQLVFSL